MKNQILKLLENLDYLKNIYYCDENIYNKNKYDMIFSAVMIYKEIEFKFKICIPKNWDRYLIDIYITNFMDIPYIPHVEIGGKICLFELEGTLIEKNLKGIIINSLKRMKDIIEMGINKENSEDFIDEFDSYYMLLPNAKKVRLLMDRVDSTLNIKCAIPHIKKRINKTYKIVESNEILVSDKEKDFDIYNYNYTVYNGILIYINSNEFIYPPDWRKKLEKDYINDILKKVDINKNIIKKYLSKNKIKKFIIFQIKEPNDNIIYFGIQLNNFILKEEKNIDIKSNNLIPLSIKPVNSKELCSRGGGNINLNSKKVLVIGCGSIGGYLIEQIAKSGIGNIEVIDDDILLEENIYRNILGMEYVGRYKSEAICQYIKANIPKVNISSIQSKIEDVLEDEAIDLNRYDLIISAVGNHNVNRWLNEYMHKKRIDTTIMYIWNEVLDVGNHILIANNKYVGCYECLFRLDDKDELFDRSSYCQKGQNFTKKMLGCGTEYMPYSSTHSLRIVTYAIDFIKQIMNEGLNCNMLFSVKGSDYILKNLGYETSNRYNKQKESIKILKGEEFKQDECKFCKGK